MAVKFSGNAHVYASSVEMHTINDNDKESINNKLANLAIYDG